MDPIKFIDLIPAAEEVPFFSIIYIEKGPADVLLSGTRRILTAPSCLCLNEKEKIEIKSCESASWIKFLPSHVNSLLSFDNLEGDSSGMSESAVLDRYFLRPFIERDDSYRGIFSPGPETDISIRTKILRLASDHSDKVSPFWPCRKKSSLMDLLMQLVSACRKDSSTALLDGDDFTARIVSYLAGHYNEKITIENLCDIFDTNRNTLSKKFRASAGSTPMEYLTRLRIDMACMLLRETKLPASDILYRVGFNDTAHFSRTFKKFMKMTPSKYRSLSGV